MCISLGRSVRRYPFYRDYLKHVVGGLASHVGCVVINVNYIATQSGFAITESMTYV